MATGKTAKPAAKKATTKSKVKYFHENELFGVKVTTANDPVFNETMEVYGIFNKEHGVREAEARRLVNAVALSDMMEDDLINGRHSLQRAGVPFMPPQGGSMPQLVN
jgi:hypothetical protein